MDERELRPLSAEQSANEHQHAPAAPRAVIDVYDDPNSPTSETLRTLVEREGITDAIVVMSEGLMQPEQSRTDLAGLTKTLELAPSGRPTVVMSWFAPERLRLDPRYHAALGFPNVEFVQLPVGGAEIAAAARRAETSGRPADPLALELYTLGLSTTALQAIRHDIDSPQKREAPLAVELAIARARNLGVSGTDEEVLRAIELARPAKRPFAGRQLPGAFCDIEGTLVTRDADGNPVINELVVAELEDLATLMPVTIWTGGDVDQYRKLLAPHVPWKVTSKYLFEGAEVELAIDDIAQEHLEESYQFRAERYINVNKLL